MIPPDLHPEFCPYCNEVARHYTCKWHGKFSPGLLRGLKARWTYEANQDLRSVHNLAAEQELTDLLAAEINAEIDKEVLEDLKANAHYSYGSKAGNQKFSPGGLLVLYQTSSPILVNRSKTEEFEYWRPGIFRRERYDSVLSRVLGIRY